MGVFHQMSGITSLACQECHEKNRKDVNHYPGQDCKGCHIPTSWKEATNFGHSPIPTQCSACHGDGQRFDSYPTNHMVVGSTDCISCHRASINNNFANWTGGTFVHGPEIIAAKNCNSCHATDRPPVVTLTNINPSINDARVIDKSHFAAKDCFACHQAPTGTQLVNWRGSNAGQYEHSNAAGGNINFCLSCHMRDEHVNNDGSVAADIVNDGKCQQCHQRQRSWSDQNRNPNL
jgi:hypothetical protein